MNNQLNHYISIEPDFFQELRGEIGIEISGKLTIFLGTEEQENHRPEGSRQRPETRQRNHVGILRKVSDALRNLVLYGHSNPVDALKVFGPYVRNLHVKDGVFPANSRVLGKEVPVGEGKADCLRQSATR